MCFHLVIVLVFLIRGLHLDGAALKIAIRCPDRLSLSCSHLERRGCTTRDGLGEEKYDDAYARGQVDSFCIFRKKGDAYTDAVRLHSRYRLSSGV